MAGILPTFPTTETTTRAGTGHQTTSITPLHTTLDQTPVQTLDLLVPILVTAKSVAFRDILPRSAHPIALFLIHNPPQHVLQRQILQHHGSLEPTLLPILRPTIQHGYWTRVILIMSQQSCPISPFMHLTQAQMIS